MNSIDIICASFFRSSKLEHMLNSVLTNTHLSVINKIHLCLHQDDINSHNLIKQYQKKLQINIHCITHKIPTPGRSRNILIKNSKANYLLFLDDDIILPNHYFQTLKKIIENNSPDIFGGPDQNTMHTDIRQKLVSNILQSPFIMGPTYHRHYKDRENHDVNELYLTLCNLCIKRTILQKHNLLFNESLRRTEECELLNKLQKQKVKFHYYPQLYVHHYRRVDIIPLIKIQYLSGFYRGRIIDTFTSSTNLFFIIPLITGIGIQILPIVSPPILLFFTALHFIITLVEIVRINKSINPYILIYSYLIAINIHIFFSIGLSHGFITRFWRDKSLD